MAVTGSFYGRDRFDPILILSQIILLQASFYTSYLLLLIIFNRATGTSSSIAAQMFSSTLTLRNLPGWVTSAALVTALCGPTALAFVAVVGRARRCADFAATLLIAHVIATSVHSGFPMNITWWIVHCVAIAGLATVGEVLSLKVELREIAVPDLESGRTESEDAD